MQPDHREALGTQSHMGAWRIQAPPAASTPVLRRIHAEGELSGKGQFYIGIQSNKKEKKDNHNFETRKRLILLLLHSEKADNSK